MNGDNIESVPAWVYRVDSPLTVDEEPWTLEDPLAPARGCLLGLLLGLAAWALLGVIVWLVWPRG